MAVQHRCRRHGRPAVASRVRLLPDGTQETEYLCDIDLAEERMSSGFGGGRSLFDDFFSDFFAVGPAGGGGGRGARSASARSSGSTSRSSSATRRGSCCSGRRRPRSSGAASTSTRDHLLHAALQDDVVRHVLEQIDADPDAIAAQVEEEADRAERTDVAPSLSPDAKAALLAAYEESRELGSSYVGPEHVLLALARDTESTRASCSSASASRTRSSAAP